MSSNNVVRSGGARPSGGKRKKKDYTTLKLTLISLLMMVSMVLGVFSARWWTTPKDSEIVEQFDDGTLEAVVIEEEKCNVLIMGTDTSGMLTDVLMIAQIDPIKKKASILSIPRDTYIKYKNYTGKINGVHSRYYNKELKSGSEDVILAVKELTGMPIHHYIKFNTKAFRQCVDELGGVDFYVPQNMKYSDPAQDLYIDLKKGQQHLDGDKAEQLVRFRSYKNGDIGRIKVQQDFIAALLEQKLNLTYVGEVGDIYSVIIENLETSMSPEDAVTCGDLLLEIGKENIKTVTLPHAFVENKPYVKPLYKEILKVREEYFGYDETGKEI